MRVLLLVTDLEIGGTPTVVRELAVRLRETGVEVEVACLGGWGAVAEQLAGAGVRVTALRAKGVWDWSVVGRVVSLIREREIGVVFSFLVHANVVAAAVGMVCRGVRYLQAIQTTQPWPRWHWWAQGIAQYAAEKVVAPSASVAKAAEDWAGVPREKIVVIPNAVDVSEEVREKPVKAGEWSVGFLGRLDPVKRVGDLLQAVRLLGEGVHLHVYGEGRARRGIEAEIVRLGIGERVTMHGATDRPGEAMGRMDVLVLPSEAEGFGLVLIEAMASGVPVVASDVPGIRDVVRDGETGLLVAVGCPGELAGAVRRVMTDTALREKLVRQGREEVRRRFAWEGVIGAYREVLGCS